MKNLIKFSHFAFYIPVVLLVSLIVVYQGNEKPLSPEEVNEYLSKIENQTQKPGGRHDMQELRIFLEDDDGKPFYTVNLYRYYPQAQYLDGRNNQGSGSDAYDRFSSVMVKLLAKQSSHPIFGSNWLEGGSDWDRLVIVRYRSRRDIAEVFSSTEFAEASAHKWASIEKIERMLVQGFHFPELNILAKVIMVLLVLFFIVFKFQDIKKMRKPKIVEP